MKQISLIYNNESKKSLTVPHTALTIVYIQLKLSSTSPYSTRVRKNTDHKKLRIWTLFTQLIMVINTLQVKNTGYKCYKYRLSTFT